MNLFETAIKFTTKGDAEVKAGLDGVASSIDGLKSRFDAVLGVLAGGALFKETISKSVELADHLKVLSEKTGETVEQLSRLEYAAQMSHVEAGALDIALKKLSMSMQGVNLDTGNAVKAFDVMGVNVKNANGTLKSQTEVLMLVADRFASYKDGAAKAALAMDIFGRSGVDMIPLLNKGRDGIKELTEESDKLGLTMSKQDEEVLVKYGETMKQVNAVVERLGRAVAVGMVPALTNLGNAFTGAAGTAKTFESIVDGVARMVAFLANVVIETKIALQGFYELIKILATFVESGWKAAVVQMVTSADTLTKAEDVAADAITRNRLIMMGHKDVVVATTDALNKQSKALKDAPSLAPKDDKALKAWLKTFLETQKEEIAAMEKKYELDVELADTNLELKQKLLDRELLEVISIYGAESAQYYEMLIKKAQLDKEFAARRKAQLDAQQREDDARWAETLAHLAKVEAKAQELTIGISNIIQATFASAFKGGGISGVFKALGDTVLQAIGGILVRMGETYVAASGILTPLAALLINPFTAGWATAAYGAALIALGAALGAIGGGGGGSVASGGSYQGVSGAQPPTTTQIIFGQNSATSAAGMTPVTPVYATFIGPNDPVAQRGILELIAKAQRRGG